MRLTAYGSIRQGKVALDDVRSYTAGVATFGEGEEIVFTIESVDEHYTRAQEKFFHGPVLKAFMTLGYRKQEAKDILALQLIPQEVKQLDGSIVRVPGHTSALTKTEYTEFIEACIQLAAEEGIVIQDSDQWRSRRDVA